MAFRHQEESSQKAEPGDALLVVHDFEARSPDELSLAKGDRIELLERDEAFGDGWFLGKHLHNGSIGLFPEVYTSAPHKGSSTFETVFHPTPNIPTHQQLATVARGDQRFEPSVQDETLSQRSLQKHAAPHNKTEDPRPSPLQTTQPLQRTASMPITSASVQLPTTPAQRSISLAIGKTWGHDEDSPVMNETLSVIDEHITDMNTPRSSLLVGKRRGTNDSGSEYSSHLDFRASYIAGHETDEEEHITLTEEGVSRWTPSQVAQYLKSVAVDSHHCEVFKDQEITGEVLLRMDQASLFLKEFDLGLVGRRLRTWHKIKALQDDVRRQQSSDLKASQLFGANDSSEDLDGSRIRASNSNSMLPRIPSLLERPGSTHAIRQQILEDSISPRTKTVPRSQSMHTENNKSPAPFSLMPGANSPRPSAASIREANHSRRQSLIDLGSISPAASAVEQNGSTSPSKVDNTNHRKNSSFDRNWSLNGSTQSTLVQSNTRPASRPASSISVSGHGLTLSNDRNNFDPGSRDSGYITNVPRDIDRGYTSGDEFDRRKSRNVLRKRDVISTNHSRQSSYVDDSRRKSITASKRHSRFGSADSIRDTVSAMTSPASQIYHNSSLKGRFRNSSANEARLSSSLAKPTSSPIVTKLEYDAPTSQDHSPKPDLDFLAEPASSTPDSRKSTSASHPRMGLRAISDAITGSEKASIGSPSSVPSPVKERTTQSPARTGSTTPSAASKSLDLESTDVSTKGTNGPGTGITSRTGTTRRKSKKETSAYIRGLEKKGPKEQMVGCEYSGWMKKKSSNLMTTWKPRLFVLRGRRLSYYYSDSDIQEKGLIDISGHRVLPADNEIITGLHAAVTGAKSSPTSPLNSQIPTIASTQAAAEPQASPLKPGMDNTFIFKLVPPRSGLSRAVNFTKPTIHYFAVDNIKQGRLWMAALMKATIDRDDLTPISSTYQQKTISLAKAKAMRHRPPALMGPEERAEGAEASPAPAGIVMEETGLNIHGLDFDKEGAGVLVVKNEDENTADTFREAQPPTRKDEEKDALKS